MITKFQKVKLVESKEQVATSEARRMLNKLNVNITSLPPEPVFEERFELPFLETEDGARYFGIQGIKRFISVITGRSSA